MALRHIACVFAGSLLACSGSSGSDDLFGGDSSQTSSPTDPAPADPSPPSGGATGGGSSSPGSGAPSGAPSGTSAPPAAPPPATCTAEAEPNDTIAKATPFATSFCGKIATRDDVDYGSIVAPSTATKMTYAITSPDGKVAHRFFVNGLPAVFDNGGSIKVVPGATYTVEVSLPTSGTSGHPSYEVKISFD